MKKCWIAVIVFVLLGALTPGESFATTYYTLTLKSSNPSSGVGITVSPNDRYGRGSGTTQFTRSYARNTAVTLTAPAALSGKIFQKWKKGYSDYSTNQSVSVAMTAGTTMTAVYIADTTSPTGSVDINNGAAATNNATVSLALSCSDASGCSQMQFSNDNSTWSTAEAYAATKAWTLSAGDGAKTVYAKFGDAAGNWSTSVSDAITLNTICRLSTVKTWAGLIATAPTVTVSPSDGGNGYVCGTTVTLSTSWNECNSTFNHWEKFTGVDIGYGYGPLGTVPGGSTITLTLNDPWTYIGPVYDQQRIKFFVESSNPDSGIDVSVAHCDSTINATCVANNVQTVGFPVDFWGSWVANPFFWCGHTAQVTAPAVSPEGHIFQKWLKNGQDYATTPAAQINQLYNDMTLTAVYAKPPAAPRTLTLTSSNPDTDVKIAVSPKDTAELANGTAPFTRTFDEGAVVTLAAPSRAGSAAFRKWQKDGTDFALSQAVSVTMSADVAMTAVYSALTNSHASLTWTGNYAICQQCHMDKVNEVYNSLHYQWQGDASKMLTGFSGMPAQPIQGKIGTAMNAFCINILGNFDGACGSCHVGLGKRPDDTAITTQQHLDNIDCLLCHQKAYKRKKQNGVYVPDTANMSITMDQALQTLHKPERVNCLQCHAKAGGGDAVKRGDLAMATGATADRHYDVHMATTGANLECQACHTPVQHKFPGRGSDLRPIETDIKMSCSTSACHPAKSGALGHKTSSINRHVDHVACQTCHIPVYAKNASDTTANEATEMSRDWRVPEWSTASNRYEAVRTTANNVPPVYRWFGDKSWVSNLGEVDWYYCSSHFFLWSSPADQGLCAISGPWPYQGLNGIDDPGNYKLTAFKFKTAWQPMSTWGTQGNNQLIPLSTKKYFETGDYDAAVRDGMYNKWGSADLPYTTVQTYEYLMLNHQVTPTADAPLTCASCHTINGVPGSFINLKEMYTSVGPDGKNADTACMKCHWAVPDLTASSKGVSWPGIHNRMLNVRGSVGMAEGLQIGLPEIQVCAYCHNNIPGR